MNPTFTKYDHIGHGLDTASFIVLGIAYIFFYLRWIRKKMQSGDWNEAKGKSQSKRAWLVGCLFIGFGILRIFGVL